ncbi:MAG: hypothetical protein LUC22_01330 [Prevotella sp.]|nr:hypothetical protein [Prevotella sp.]
MAVKTKREALQERLRGKYPDKSFDDDEEIYGAVNDDYDAADKERADWAEREKGYKDREQGLVDMMDADPRSAMFLDKWRHGGDPSVELVRQYGMEIKDAIDDPERLKEIEAANKEYLERVTEGKKLEEQYAKNLKKSIEDINALQQQEGLSDDEVNEGMTTIITIIKDGVLGKITPETLQMVFKAVNHDDDVAQAQREGEVAGRNAKITERLRQAKGDGIPRPASGANTPVRNRQPANDIFALAAQAQ